MSYNPATAEDWERASEFWQSESYSFAPTDAEYAQFCADQALRCANQAGQLMADEALADLPELYQEGHHA